MTARVRAPDNRIVTLPCKRVIIRKSEFEGGEMGLTKKKEPVIEIPLTVFETAETKEDLEDWLLAQSPEFVKRIRKAREDDLAGKGVDWKTLKKDLCIK